MKSIIDFFRYDNGVAILALIFSIVNFYFSHISKQINIRFIITNNSPLKCRKNNFLILNAIVENCSQLPITITNISLIYKEQVYNFHPYSEFSDCVFIPVENGQDIQEVNHTTGFPIKIAGLDAEHCRFKIKFPIDVNINSDFILNISTTRGLIVKKINYHNK